MVLDLSLWFGLDGIRLYVRIEFLDFTQQVRRIRLRLGKGLGLAKMLNVST
jgi:hypothetical protein